MSNHIVTESELVLPALRHMNQHGGQITTSTLIHELEKEFCPTGIDAEKLRNRSDTHFSQKVRNLKSHKTFEKNGYAEEIDGGFRITEKGKKKIASTNGN